MDEMIYFDFSEKWNFRDINDITMNFDIDPESSTINVYMEWCGERTYGGGTIDRKEEVKRDVENSMKSWVYIPKETEKEERDVDEKDVDTTEEEDKYYCKVYDVNGGTVESVNMLKMVYINNVE
eukprot:Seg3562.15 transcript_id=Seg3562.15/GoldUCD/mRNA.D3Y31 product="hypothetical protein" protein_id=Seg3562.15/GoldUCD/D3Y31